MNNPISRVGRRPGNADTRAEIIGAARDAFLEEGYDKASLRGIARRAGVDPALVHHYFDGKPALFIEAMSFGRDPRDIFSRVKEGGGGGELLVQRFLEVWEAPDGEGPSPFVSAMQAVSASAEAADALREFLEDRVWSQIEAEGLSADQERRRSLVASQLFGLGWVRYIMRLEPIASAPIEVVAKWVGPTLERYFTS